MSDESPKKAGARPERATPNRLRAGLSQGLKTEEDPLAYHWIRVDEAPPSEVTCAPPMPIPAPAVETGDVDFADYAIDMDGFGDAILTEEAPAAPVSDDRYVVTQRFVAVRQPRRSGWVWMACAIATVVGCAVIMWLRRGADQGIPADSAVSRDLSPMKAVTRPTVSALPAPAVAVSTPSTSVVSDLPAAPVVAVPVLRRPLPSDVTRNLPSPPQPAPRTAPAREVVDPLFTEKPGY
jgi:hypothetical protein